MPPPTPPPLSDERTADPGDELISYLVHAEHEGESLTRDEVFATVILLFLGGHETTAALITNVILARNRHPE